MAHDVTDFQSEVIERSREIPVLVDFWAAWCGPCRTLGPVLEKLAGEASGRWVLAKVDTEAMPEVAEAYRIQSIPNVKLFAGGEVVDEFVGAVPEAQVRRWLESALPSPHGPALDEARRLLERSEFVPAAEAARSVLAAEPSNREARLLLAATLLHTDPSEVEDAVRGLEEDPSVADRVEALRTLAAMVARPGEEGGLPETPARGRVLAGLEAVRNADWAMALEAFIEVLSTDRGEAGVMASTAGRAIFRLLGWQHPVCERYHRAFTSAIHV